MNKIKLSITSIIVIMLGILYLPPLAILLIKLSVYLFSNAYQEWWVSIIWVLSLPMITIVLYLLKKGNDVK